MAAPKGNKNAIGNKGGTPTIYGKRIIQQTEQYLKDFKKNGEVIPTIEGLAVYLKIGRRTIYDWAKQEDKVEFSHIVEALLSLQSRDLVSGGLSNKMNSNIAKLLLGKHGYKEESKQEVKILNLAELLGKADED